MHRSLNYPLCFLKKIIFPEGYGRERSFDLEQKLQNNIKLSSFDKYGGKKWAGCLWQ